ncbi:class A sortase [Enterococcus faecalis]|nr:class A sortase [Enterococcus faecalis]
MKVIWQTIKYYKYQVGAIGIILIALFSFWGYSTIQAKEKQEKQATVQTLKEINASGVKEAKIPKEKNNKDDHSPAANDGQLNIKNNDSTKDETENERVKNEETIDALSTGERPTPEEIKAAHKNFNQVRNDIVGTLTISSIGLEMPILTGDSFNQMLYGACEVLSKQTMGQGNYPLAAHNAGIPGLMFSSLKDVQLGDKVTLTDRNNQSWTYEITEKKNVDMTDTSILNSTLRPRVTLITCDQETETTGRDVVIAELI